MQKRRYPMPVQPFAELIENWMRNNELHGIPYEDNEKYVDLGVTPPLTNVCEKIAEKYHANYSSVARRVYEIRNGKIKKISFDFADAIVCATSNPVFWYEDGRVRDRYMDIREPELVAA